MTTTHRGQSHDLTERFRKERDEAVELLREAQDIISYYCADSEDSEVLAKIDALLARIGK